MTENPTIPELLRQAAQTFEDRNAVYGDNYKNVGNVMIALFPKGIRLETAEDFLAWHIFELIVVKMTRLANSNLTHEDSIHDITVYAAMLEHIMNAIKEASNATAIG